MSAVPDLQFGPPDCPRCERETELDYTNNGYRCDHCRLMWGEAGRHGQSDPRTPIDRLRDACEAHGRMEISTAEFSDRVYEFIKEASQ